jgi:hypothetical protein
MELSPIALLSAQTIQNGFLINLITNLRVTHSGPSLPLDGKLFRSIVKFSGLSDKNLLGLLFGQIGIILFDLPGGMYLNLKFKNHVERNDVKLKTFIQILLNQ